MRIPMRQEIAVEVRRSLLLKSNGSQPDYHQKAHIIRALRQLGMVTARNLINRKELTPIGNAPVQLVVTPVLPKRSARHDPPNFWPTCKPIIDGFTDAKLWDDDNGRIIPRTSFDWTQEISSTPGLWIMRFTIVDWTLSPEELDA